MAGRELSCGLILLLTVSSAWAQPPSPSGSDPVLDQLKATAEDFERRVRSAGSAETIPTPAILLDTPPQLSKYTRKDNTIHTSRWEELAPDLQDNFKRWAGYAGDKTGKQLFDEMFHRFFFVHELGHWLQIQATPDTNDVYSHELEANRLAVAYWRESDTPYLAALLARFRRISGGLPDPVPPGQDAEQYFNSNYGKLGSNPDAYGWFQTRMVIRAGTERPIRPFAETVQRLSQK
jgi:hypothetical protein